MIFDNFFGMVKLSIVVFTPIIFYSLMTFIAVIFGSIIFAIVKKSKKALLLALVAFLCIGGLALIRFSPRTYERAYLTDYTEHISNNKAITLRDVAEERSIFIGCSDTLANIDAQGYDEMIGTEFNSFTPENAFKWSKLLVNGELGNYDFTEADKYLEFAKEHDMRLRGHALVWGKGYPAELQQMIANAENPEEFMKNAIDEHISAVVGRYKGEITVWDVVNEPMDLMEPALEENIFFNAMGEDYIKYAFYAAHRADPDAKLVLNSYIGADPDFLYNLLSDMISEGVPITGFGLQGHVMDKPGDIDKIVDFLQRVSDLGLDVEITEMDVRLRAVEGFGGHHDIYENQGNYYGLLLERCLEIENFTGITTWGVSDRNTWYDSTPPYAWMQPTAPLLFDDELEKKPAYYHIFDVLAEN